MGAMKPRVGDQVLIRATTYKPTVRYTVVNKLRVSNNFGEYYEVKATVPRGKPSFEFTVLENRMIIVCRNCGYPRADHSSTKKCLFGSTKWQR